MIQIHWESSRRRHAVKVGRRRSSKKARSGTSSRAAFSRGSEGRRGELAEAAGWCWPIAPSAGDAAGVGSLDCLLSTGVRCVAKVEFLTRAHYHMPAQAVVSSIFATNEIVALMTKKVRWARSMCRSVRDPHHSAASNPASVERTWASTGHLCGSFVAQDRYHDFAANFPKPTRRLRLYIPLSTQLPPVSESEQTATDLAHHPKEEHFLVFFSFAPLA
jgi:hypothetical protein